MTLRLQAVFPLALCLALHGCSRHRAPLADGPKPPRPLPVVARSVKGIDLVCRAFGSGRAAVLIIGGIHGSEPASTELAKALTMHLETDPSLGKRRRILVVEAANPDGLAARTRTNARGVDLNRNFPTPNWTPGGGSGPTPLSEPETRFLADLITHHRPACIVQIHQPLSCVDWDGPARDLAKAMAESCRLRARKLGARPGSLGSYAGLERNIPTITLELPRSASQMSRAALWNRYGAALRIAIESVRDETPRVRFGGSIEYTTTHTRSH